MDVSDRTTFNAAPEVDGYFVDNLLHIAAVRGGSGEVTANYNNEVVTTLVTIRLIGRTIAEDVPADLVARLDEPEPTAVGPELAYSEHGAVDLLPQLEMRRQAQGPQPPA